MKTKAGRALLKEHTKEMDRLNREMADLALELKGMEAADVKLPRRDQFGQVSLFQNLVDRAAENRTYYHELQQEINEMIALEAFLPEK